jgi:hypothetical protein
VVQCPPVLSLLIGFTKVSYKPCSEPLRQGLGTQLPLLPALSHTNPNLPLPPRSTRDPDTLATKWALFPKVELHVHLDGAFDAHVLWEALLKLKTSFGF